MAMTRRGRLCSRIAILEREAELALVSDDRPRVTLYMPRKDGDTQPYGVISESRWFRMILYDANQQTPLHES